MKRSRLGLVLVVVAALMVALWWQRRGPADDESTAASKRPVAGQGNRASDSAAARTPRARAGRGAVGNDRAAGTRARLERDIIAARERRLARERAAAAAPAQPAGPAPALSDVGQLDKEYIQDRVRDIVPLIKECYEASLAEDPAIAGRLVVSFTLTGEPEVGGIVEDSEIVTDESTLLHPGVNECVRESIYAMEFDPPADGGRVVVRYPFIFRSGDE